MLVRAGVATSAVRDNTQVERVIDAPDRAELLQSTVAALRGRFPPRGSDRPIEDNPLLLTCIFVLFHEMHRLPDNTADLYKRMVEILCGTRAARAEEADLEADSEEVRRQSGAVRHQQARAIAAALQAEGGTAVRRSRVASRLCSDAERWIDQVRNPGRPVVGVDFIEALALCRWATENWVLPGAGLVDLPTSTEWESIVRREGGGKYPWGDAPEPANGDPARANYLWEGERPRAPTPIGAFPAGDVQRGGRTIHDLVGNVCVWTRSTSREPGRDWDVPPTAANVSVGYRAVRGGGWVDDDVRSSGVEWHVPWRRFGWIGVRMVFRPQLV